MYGEFPYTFIIQGFIMSDLQSYLDEALKQVDLFDVEEEPFIVEYDIEAELRELIASTRIKLGITQNQLAEKSGVSQANISKIENGSYRPSIVTLKKIADGLGKRLTIDFVDYEEVL